MTDVPLAERRKGVAAIAAVTLIWSVNFVAARPAAEAIDPFILTFGRAAAAVLVFLPVLLLKGGRRLLTARNLLEALPLALACILLNQVLFLLATRHTTPAHVALVVATIPVFVAVIARLFLGERLARRRVLGIAIAFLGVALLALEPDGAGSKHPSATGDLLAGGAALSFAAFTVANKALVARVGALPATALVYLDGALLLLPLAVLRHDGAAHLPPPLSLASAAYLIVASTLVAYPLFSYALARLTASRVAVFTYLQPTLAAAFSFALGWETFPPRTLIGAALAVAGVALAQRRRSG